MNLCDYDSIRELLARHGFHFSKSMGQNFLIDPAVPAAIADASEADKGCGVLEIGPGIGPLTAELAARAGRVVSVELDKALLPVLAETMAPYSNVEIVPGDVMKLDLAKLAEEKLSGLRPIVCANLPYNITTPVLTKLVETPCFESITVMIQKEVAERLGAEPGNKDYGAITLSINYYSDANIVMTVPASCFMPRPNVDSAVIRMDIYDKPPVATKDEVKMFKVIKAAFSQRRKTLVNSVSSSTDIAKETILKSLNEMGLSESVRGETLSLEQFAELSDRIIENS